MSLFAQKNVEVDGVTYTLQKIPFRNYMEINDRCTNRHGVLMKTPYTEELLKHCVVNPRTTFSTFDDNVGAGMELIGEIESFLNSKTERVASEEKSE